MTDAELREWIDQPRRRAEVSAVAVTEAFLERIESVGSRLGATVASFPDRALADARRLDASPAPRPAPLPVVVKDNVAVAGTATSAGAAALDDLALADAPAIGALRAAGGIVLAKTNMNELALGGTTRNARYGDCLNPWDLERIPGGSSGGSAVAVAADLCVAAVGTDTGGSVRLPASICGVSGLRPSPGAISADGVVPTSRSHDTIGPLARSAAQAGALLAALGGGAEPAEPGRRSLAGLRVALVIADGGDGGADVEIATAVAGFADALADLGAVLEKLELPGFEAAAATAGELIAAEAYETHGHLLDAVEDETRERLMIGAAADRGALRARADEWRGRVAAALDGGPDLLLTPTLPVLAPRREAGTVAATRSIGRYTYPWSLAGLPALSVPCGATADGLPIGAQLAAAPGADALLLEAAAVYQDHTDWHLRRPPGLAAGPTAVEATR